MINIVRSNRIYLIAITFFLLASMYGVLIRWNFVFPLNSISYSNLLHGHSHVAFLGWGYLATIGLIIQSFIPKDRAEKKWYSMLLGIITLTIIGMLFSFMLNGYSISSIVLLLVFGVVSYVISYKILKDITGNSISVKFIRFSIYYYLLSSLATYFLAVVLITQGKTDLYYNTVYFYLHFLYNGFFVFALFGLLLKHLENLKISISKKLSINFFIFLNIACIPTYALSVLWSDVSSFYYVFGFFGAFLQCISSVFLLKIIRDALRFIEFNRLESVLWFVFLISYFLKIIAQLLSSFPYFVKYSIALKPFFIIGYIHLFTLGFMSVLLFFLLYRFGKIDLFTRISKIGVALFVLGVFLTEIILFGQGFLLQFGFKMYANYNLILLTCSIVLVFGLLLIYVNQFKKKAPLL